MLIGLSSRPLHLEALKAAVKEARSGLDLQHYENAVSALQDVALNDIDAIPDMDWVDRVKKTNDRDTSRLEGELKGYKNNLIKESIRVSLKLALGSASAC